jgi:hypothetical protein
MDKSFHTSFERATEINECSENDPTPAGLVDRGLQTSGGCRIKHKSPESSRDSGMIASRFGSSNALGDHVPPLPCLCCCPGRIYCGCEAFASEDSLTGWTALRARGSGSFSSPSGSHRLRQLRATFRCKVEFFLHLFGSARLFHGSGRFLAGSSTRRGGSELLFQLGEFLPTFLQPTFEPADPFPETFKVFHIRKESPRRLLMRMTE